MEQKRAQLQEALKAAEAAKKAFEEHAAKTAAATRALGSVPVPSPASARRLPSGEAIGLGLAAALRALFGNTADKEGVLPMMGAYIGQREQRFAQEAEEETARRLAQYKEALARAAAEREALQEEASLLQAGLQSALGSVTGLERSVGDLEKEAFELLKEEAKSRSSAAEKIALPFVGAAARVAEGDASLPSRVTEALAIKEGEADIKEREFNARVAAQAQLLKKAADLYGSEFGLFAASHVAGGGTVAQAIKDWSAMDAESRRVAAYEARVDLERLETAQNAGFRQQELDIMRQKLEIQRMEAELRASGSGKSEDPLVKSLKEQLQVVDKEIQTRLEQLKLVKEGKTRGPTGDWRLDVRELEDDLTRLYDQHRALSARLKGALNKSAARQGKAQAPEGAASVPEWRPPSEKVVKSMTGDLASQALMFLGAPYRWGGGRTPACRSYDCSGLLAAIDRMSGGVYGFKGSASELYRSLPKIGPKDARRGDLVFFDWNKDGRADHVGVYLGDGRMVHARGGRDPRKWRKVEVSSVSEGAMYARPRAKVTVNGRPALVVPEVFLDG
jgi:cell wall-associated NlpC family hydrolase